MKEKIKQIYLIPVSNPSDADELMCPCCLNKVKVIGYAGLEHWFPGHPLKHKEGCLIEQVWIDKRTT